MPNDNLPSEHRRERAEIGREHAEDGRAAAGQHRHGRVEATGSEPEHGLDLLPRNRELFQYLVNSRAVFHDAHVIDRCDREPRWARRTLLQPVRRIDRLTTGAARAHETIETVRRL
jgi:hypothetical protein